MKRPQEAPANNRLTLAAPARMERRTLSGCWTGPEGFTVPGRDPLSLAALPHWEIRDVSDPECFVANVGDAALGGTILFIECASPSVAARDSLDKLHEPGPYIPETQSLWTRPRQWRLPFTAAVLKEVADLMAHHAEPEVADHLFIYSGDRAVLEWADAFVPDVPAIVSSAVSEEVATDLARRVGGRVTFVQAGGPTTR